MTDNPPGCRCCAKQCRVYTMTFLLLSSRDRPDLLGVGVVYTVGALFVVGLFPLVPLCRNASESFIRCLLSCVNRVTAFATSCGKGLPLLTRRPSCLLMLAISAAICFLTLLPHSRIVRRLSFLDWEQPTPFVLWCHCRKEAAHAVCTVVSS